VTVRRVLDRLDRAILALPRRFPAVFYGRIGIASLAEVCRFGDAGAQQSVHDEIKANGAAAGRALLVGLVFDARSSGSWQLRIA
jgi:hypothetical protein